MPTLGFDIKTTKSMFDINVWGMMRVTQAFAPLLIAVNGTIANISSVDTAVPPPWLGKTSEDIK